MTHILPFQEIHRKHRIKKVNGNKNKTLPSQHTTLTAISKTKYSNADFFNPISPKRESMEDFTNGIDFLLMML